MACDVVYLSLSRGVRAEEGEHKQFLVFQCNGDKLTRGMDIKCSNIISKSDREGSFGAGGKIKGAEDERMTNAEAYHLFGALRKAACNREAFGGGKLRMLQAGSNEAVCKVIVHGGD